MSDDTSQVDRYRRQMRFAPLAAPAKPLMAIRTAPSHAGVEQARAAADRLQADLAPEFSLAGYFARRLS